MRVHELIRGSLSMKGREMHINKLVLSGVFGVSLIITACSDQGSQQTGIANPVGEKADVIQLSYDPEKYTKGLELYQGACASCHGKQGEGALNWQQKATQGKAKPPPLNGTGHAWHHPMHILKGVVRNGTARLGGNMPAWKDKLTDEQIQNILYWMQSQWPKEIYNAWYLNNQEALRNRARGKK
ncbi:MAG TPA: cytochrome c [Gammaproteobacteria bacterium]|nr:cytochrome c [Gammaproteobacteria bacterium]